MSLNKPEQNTYTQDEILVELKVICDKNIVNLYKNKIFSQQGKGAGNLQNRYMMSESSNDRWSKGDIFQMLMKYNLSQDVMEEVVEVLYASQNVPKTKSSAAVVKKTSEAITNAFSQPAKEAVSQKL